jgi:L-threonylcarbamoyladenylate synthase
MNGRGVGAISGSAAPGALERCIEGGGIAVFPADTVYGLACDPANRDAVERLYALKGRELSKPSAVMFFELGSALDALRWVGPRTREAMLRLLPGGVTLLVPNPGHAFPLACGEDPDTLGVRVPEVPLLAGARCAVLQSSANLAGGSEARRLSEVAQSLLDAVDLVIDGGELPGLASSVIDLREYEAGGRWSVLRAGAVGEAALSRALGEPSG